MKKIYVLHEYGAPAHYNALVKLAEKHNCKVVFNEFQLKGQIKKMFVNKDLFIRFIINCWCLIKLPFIRKTKIILGIAPFNPLLPLLMHLLKKHEVYYHTSYTHWDGIICGYSTNSFALKKKWKYFTNKYVQHIFAVSNKTKEELIKYGFSTKERISVVFHSYNYHITPLYRTKDNTFIFVGRLTEQKGIKELLQLFAYKKEAHLTLIGEGSDEELVKQYSNRHNNIHFVGPIKGLKNIIPYYHSASFVLMNSQRSKDWEELFGISIIEGMSCGCVPITTDHPGPKEIISNQIDGIICKEGFIKEGIEQALLMDNQQYQSMRQQAIKKGQYYQDENIATLWKKIFE